MEVPSIPEKLIVKNEYTFNITSDKGNSFTINLKNYSQYILVHSEFKNELLITEYENKYFLKDFKDNKFLSICDSIDEIYEQLILEIKKQNNIKIIEEDSKINIIIPIEIVKIKEIKLTLEKKIISDKELINNLINDYKNFKTEIEEKYNKLLIENQNLKKNYDEVIEKINFLTNEIKKINDEKKLLQEQNNDISNSLIIKNDVKKQNYIINWIKEKTKKDMIKFDLIFTMSKNGNKSADFHRHCDNKGPTLTLIKTTKNQIFGGFTPLNWNKDNGKRIIDPSNQTFIFSLDLFKKFDMIDKTKDAIYYDSDCGPDFGNCDILLKSNMKEGKCCANEYCNFLSNNNIELTGEKGNYISFQTEELEIYKVIYN